MGIVTVPRDQAQDVADGMVDAGIRGILNFAPVPLKVPPYVHVEDIDVSMSLEKVAFFARNNKLSKDRRQGLRRAGSAVGRACKQGERR